MRIISGTARGRKLAGFSGRGIRPTADRVREAIFSSLCSRAGGFSGKRVLDIFAGTGAMGIEALSRGADAALFIDRSAESARLIERNLKSTGLMERGTVRLGNALHIMQALSQSDASFDLIFIDPPYAGVRHEELLDGVNRLGLLQSDGIMTFETAAETTLPESAGSLHRFARRVYGSTAISYYRHSDSGNG